MSRFEENSNSFLVSSMFYLKGCVNSSYRRGRAFTSYSENKKISLLVSKIRTESTKNKIKQAGFEYYLNFIRMEEPEEPETVFFTYKEFAVEMANQKILSEFLRHGTKISNENRAVVEKVFEKLDYYIPWNEKSPQIQTDKRNLRSDYHRMKVIMQTNQRKGVELFHGMSDKPFISSKKYPGLFKTNQDKRYAQFNFFLKKLRLNF